VQILSLNLTICSVLDYIIETYTTLQYIVFTLLCVFGRLQINQYTSLW